MVYEKLMPDFERP